MNILVLFLLDSNFVRLIMPVLSYYKTSILFTILGFPSKPKMAWIENYLYKMWLNTYFRMQPRCNMVNSIMLTALMKLTVQRMSSVVLSLLHTWDSNHIHHKSSHMWILQAAQHRDSVGPTKNINDSGLFEDWWLVEITSFFRK